MGYTKDIQFHDFWFFGPTGTLFYGFEYTKSVKNTSENDWGISNFSMNADCWKIHLFYQDDCMIVSYSRMSGPCINSSNPSGIKLEPI